MISGKVVGKEIDENGNIKVYVDYILTDGSVQHGSIRFAFWNYTPEKIKDEIKAHCENLMRKIYALKKHQELIRDVDISNINYECTFLNYIIKQEEKDAQGNIIQNQETIIIDDK